MSEFERDDAAREAARLERQRRREAARVERQRAQQAARSGQDDEALGDGGDLFGEPYDEEEPIGIRRVSRGERANGSRVAVDAPPRETRPRVVREPRRRPPRHRPPRLHGEGRSRRWRWIGRIVAVLALVLAVAVLWFLDSLYQPFHGSAHGRVTVTVPANAGAHQIGNLLAARGVVSSGFFFDLRASLSGERSKLRSGTYHLQLGMSYAAALKALTTAPPAAKTTELTTTPGHTRAGLAILLAKQGVHGYLVDTRHSPLINLRAYGAPASTRSLEGFLFPDTYQLRVPVDTQTFVNDQLTRFKQEFATVNMSYARSQHMTPYQVLTIASLVQAEGQTTHDMPLVASVIYNRLREGIMLQFDSTTRYATGNFTRPLTVSQLKSGSPWNTHTHTGLPPTPINNPGLTAIKAAANPPRTNDLYFVSKPCSGALAFSSSYSKFLRDVAAFNATQSQNGQPPAKRCPSTKH